MKNLRQNRPRYVWRSIVLPIIVCVAMLAIFGFGVYKFNEISLEQDRQLTYSAVHRAVVQCYADEGRYPADIAYLEDNYNLKIDYDHFRVVYDCVASNVSPNIAVFRRR